MKTDQAYICQACGRLSMIYRPLAGPNIHIQNVHPTKIKKISCRLRQNAESFKDKMGGFRKSIKNIADLVFIDAPHVIPDECNSDELGPPMMKPGRSWWFSSENSTFSSREKCLNAKGFLESVAAVDEAFRTQGPFDGILGFSQGGAMASLICGLKEHQEFSHDFQFVVIFGGFRSLSESHQYISEGKLNIESLHVIGKGDNCIPEELSNGLVARFHNPSVIYHEGGHYVPAHGNIRTEYMVFLKKMLERVTESQP